MSNAGLITAAHGFGIRDFARKFECPLTALSQLAGQLLLIAANRSFTLLRWDGEVCPIPNSRAEHNRLKRVANGKRDELVRNTIFWRANNMVARRRLKDTLAQLGATLP
jgi:hypothetical protein